LLFALLSVLPTAKSLRVTEGISTAASEDGDVPVDLASVGSATSALSGFDLALLCVSVPLWGTLFLLDGLGGGLFYSGCCGLQVVYGLSV
jgi:hypothetical protein